jgi:hypothetical protein
MMIVPVKGSNPKKYEVHNWTTCEGYAVVGWVYKDTTRAAPYNWRMVSLDGTVANWCESRQFDAAIQVTNAAIHPGIMIRHHVSDNDTPGTGPIIEYLATKSGHSSVSTFRSLTRSRKDWREFHFLIRHPITVRSKLAKIENIFTRDNISLLKTEDDVVIARLILGEKLIEFRDLRGIE